MDSEGRSKRKLYVALKDGKDKTMNKSLLRQLRPNEKLLEVHTMLNRKEAQHTFYALALSPLPREPRQSGQAGKKFKNGTWVLKPRREVGTGGAAAEDVHGGHSAHLQEENFLPGEGHPLLPQRRW